MRIVATFIAGSVLAALALTSGCDDVPADDPAGDPGLPPFPPPGEPAPPPDPGPVPPPPPMPVPVPDPEPTGLQPELPAPKGACPDFVEGQQASFLGVNVLLNVVGAPDKNGPLLIYWHGTGSNPAWELYAGVGREASDAIRARGGVVAGMIAGQTSGGTNTSGNGVWNTMDMEIADEVVACAAARAGIDPRRIHSLGMSAGGLQTSAYSYRRSRYLASVATYSGGNIVWNGYPRPLPPLDNPDNKFGALIFHGGPSDNVGIGFEETSKAFHKDLSDRGHPAIICNHGGGHSIPSAGGQAAWRFFQDHPFGQRPADQGSLPDYLPDYCSL